MGQASVEAAVADAGPLIHLWEIQALLLLNFIEKLYVPLAVWLEVTAPNRVPEADLQQIGNLERQATSQKAVTRFVQSEKLQELHSGEHESLYLCQQKSIPLILTDDLAVRETAKRLGLTPVGSLGIVARAYHTGMIPLKEAEKFIFALQDISSLFVTRTIVELAVEGLQRSEKYG